MGKSTVAVSMSQEVRRSQRAKNPINYTDLEYDYIDEDGNLIRIHDYQKRRRGERDMGFGRQIRSGGPAGGRVNPRPRAAPRAVGEIEAFSDPSPSQDLSRIDELVLAAQHVLGDEGPAFGPGEYPGLYDVQAGDEVVYIPSVARTVPRRAPLSAADLAHPDQNRGSNLSLYLRPDMSASRRRAMMPHERPVSLPIQQPLGSPSFHRAASPGSDSSEWFIDD
jgi:hypothetical protein